MTTDQKFFFKHVGIAKVSQLSQNRLLRHAGRWAAAEMRFAG